MNNVAYLKSQTFFAMPTFNWRENRHRPDVTPSIWIYFAVTIPVTAAVLYVWRFWFIGEIDKQDAENARARRAVPGIGDYAPLEPDASELKLLNRLLLMSANGKNGRGSKV